MGARAWLAAVLLAACSPTQTASSRVDSGAGGSGGDAGTANADDGAHSGERLKIVWWVFNDGTRTWDGTLYDTERKENCFIYEGWSDGKTYCAPLKANSNVVFTDAACSQKAVQVFTDPNCPAAAPPSILDYDYTTCSENPARVYQRGGKLATVAQYYLNYGTGCIGPFDDDGDSDYYALGPLATDLAEVTLADAPDAGTGRLSTRMWTSTDGLALPARMRDSQLGTDCFAAYLGPGAQSSLCDPETAGYFSYAHDASCSVPEFDASPGCAAPAIASTYSSSCPYDNGQYFEVGAKTSAPPLFIGDSASSCSQATPVSGDSYFAATGAALSLAPLSRTVDSAANKRIQLIHLTTPDGLAYRDQTLFDATSGTECFPEQLPDGTKLCFPEVPYGVSAYYSDAGCSTELDLVEVYTGGSTCQATPAAKYTEEFVAPEPGTCNYSYEVHSVGGKHTGTVFTGFPGECSVYAPTTSELYDVGPIVPFSQFAAATTQTGE
jgi:hypothetical protein|nr:hypothetical protein [Kofleriaceae bacterium]